MTETPTRWNYLDVWRADLACGGHVVWRRGTGGNVELLELAVATPRAGQGTRLLVAMLKSLRDGSPPYATVFGFTRTLNLEAHAFYRAVGFTLSPVAGVYADGSAVVFSGRFDELCARHLTPKETHAASREADDRHQGEAQGGPGHRGAGQNQAD